MANRIRSRRLSLEPLERRCLMCADQYSPFDHTDIDNYHAAIREGKRHEDYNRDGVLNTKDRDYLYESTGINSSGGADATLDGRTDFYDFVALSVNFGGPGGWAEGDFNGDGLVGFSDLLVLSLNFGRGNPPCINPATARSTTDSGDEYDGHLGEDYLSKRRPGEGGDLVVTPVPGKLVSVGTTPSNTYGTMVTVLEVHLDSPQTFAMEDGSTYATDAVYITFGHLRPAEQKDPDPVPNNRFENGRRWLTYSNAFPWLRAGQQLGYLEGWGANDDRGNRDEEGRLLFLNNNRSVRNFGQGTTPHLHVSMTPTIFNGEAVTRTEYLAGIEPGGDPRRHIRPETAWGTLVSTAIPRWEE